MGSNRRHTSKLGSIRHELESRLFHLPNEQWIRCNTIFNNESFFLQALLNNEMVCVTDGSLFPDRSNLLSVAWFTSINRKAIAFRDFASSVPK